ncbi:MAG TPA: IS1634 family transposase [Bacillota bacterium]|nr:IS1634 family transposase [Bacillota bacterium]
MYIRKTVQKAKNGKEYVNYLLVESVMTEKGPRQRTICSLGNLRPRPLGEWLVLARKVEEKLAGQLELEDVESDPLVAEIFEKVKARRSEYLPAEDTVSAISDDATVEKRHGAGQTQGAAPEIVSVIADRVTVEECREAGPAYVGNCFWERIGIDDVLKEAGLSAKARLLTRVMTLNRLVCPRSEHAMPGWIGTSAAGDLIGADLAGLNDDALYRNLDRLHACRDQIEKGLTARERDLFNLDASVFFYDLTSTYFEGQCARNPKAERGYSRDRRFDCKQVVLGMVVNRDGFACAHEVFEGGRQDAKSLNNMLDILEKRTGRLKGSTIVVDRGMALDENLAAIRGRECHYIVASRQAERNAWLEEFESGDWQEVKRAPSPTNPAQRKSKVLVKRAERDGETCILCISEGRSSKDAAIRRSHEERLIRDLQKLEKRVASGRLKKPEKIWEAIGRIKERYPRVARYYSIEWGETGLKWEENAEKKAIAEALDGAYLLKTDRTDLGADEAWRVYSMLTRAESAFRAMKSPLSERPIFHQTQNRVEAHIFLCILAYHLLVAVEKTLRDNGLNDSWATVRDTLSSHQTVTVVLPTTNRGTLRIRRGSAPEPEHIRIYDALGLPHAIMTPIKTWSST